MAQGSVSNTTIFSDTRIERLKEFLSPEELYKDLIKNLSVNIIASGGVSSIEDIIELKKLNLYGAIVGKAYYTGAVNLKEALEVANAD